MKTDPLFTYQHAGWRRLYKAITIPLLVALLAGLIPPPLVRSVLPSPAAELAEALFPEPAVAQAAPASAPLPTTRQLSGVVFRDFDGSGTRAAATEPGQAGIQVTVVCVADPGTDSVTGTADDSYTTPLTGLTDLAGGYSFSNLPAGPCRVEFSITADLPFLRAGPAGGTLVQFVDLTVGNGTANGGLQDPQQYTGSLTPNLVIARSEGGTAASASGLDSVTAFPFDGGSNTQRENIGDTGSLWGVAYQRSTGTVFSSATLRRHASLGPGGIDAIYAINGTGSGTWTAPAGWASPYTATDTDGGTVLPDSDGNSANDATNQANERGLASSYGPSWDTKAFSQIGKVGWGGLAITNDDTTLLGVNMYAKSLVGINIATKTSVFDSPVPTPTCTTGSARPWGVTSHDGMAYVGVVCDAMGGVEADLAAFVYAYNYSSVALRGPDGSSVAPGAWTANLLADGNAAPGFQLNYAKAGVWGAAGDNWLPWLDTFTAINTDNYEYWIAWGGAYVVARPAPILTDIDFDGDGSMIITLGDRAGLQLAWHNYSPVTTDTTFYGVGIAGDLLRASPPTIPGGTFTMESNGRAVQGQSIGGLTPPTLVGQGAGNAEGPGGGEFYSGESYGSHRETTQGGMVIIPGATTFPSAQMDPDQIVSGGVDWLTINGGAPAQSDNMLLYNTEASWGKAAGLGDLERLSALAPIEIGNRVWNDQNANGVQDPGELGIPSVIVELYKSGVKVGQATTDSSGEYYFTSGTNPTDANTNDNIIHDSSIGILPGTGTNGGNSLYEVRVPNVTGGSKQAALGGYNLTTANAGSSDTIDSDGTIPSGQNYASYPIPHADLASVGSNNHTYDFGYVPVEIGNWVWKDLNTNGLQDVGEPGLPGVMVGLYANNGNPVLCAQPSLANLALNRVAAQVSNYTASYTADKAVDGNSTSASFMSITGSVAQAWWQVDLGQSADIGQVVIYPRPDGFHDQTEQIYVQVSALPFASTNLATTLADPNVWSSSLQGAWAGASLTVSVPAYRGRYVRIQHSNTNYLALGDVQVYGNPILPVTAITDANGQYTFTGGNCLHTNSTYQVRIATAQSALLGLNPTTQDAGGVTSNDPVADNTDSDAATAVISGTQYSRINPITAPATGVNYSYDFGYVPVEIGNVVWKDLSANGLQDGGEPGIAGVTVALLDNSGNPVMCTDPGVYDTYRDNFVTGGVNNLSAGTLNWTTSWVQTNNAGVIGGSGNPDGSLQAYAGSTAYYSTRAVDLSVFATQPTLSFDYNMAGTASQFNIQYSVNGGTSFTTLAVLSDNNNSYKSITYTLPSTITVATAQLRIRGQGTGTWAYFDNLTFRGQRNYAQTTVTDSNGQYTFTGVDCVQPSGSYRLRIANNQTVLQGLFATAQNAGGVTSNDPVADNTDSDAATTTVGAVQYSQINPVTAPAAGANYSYDFGYVPVEIGNVVWKDNNRNNLQDGGEPGIAGVTVALLDNSGNPVMCTDPGVYDTYRDNFVTGGVNNQSAGTLNWTTNWVQTNNAGVIGGSGNPDGSLQAYAGSTAYYSTRAVDLSVFATQPTLSFDYNMAGTASQFNIQYSVNGGTSFTTLAVLSDNNNGYKSITYTLPSTITVATAQLRIRGQGTGTWAYFDNLTFRGQRNYAQTTVTDSNGQYTFTGVDCVQPSGSYRLRIANNQPALDGLFAVSQNAGGVTSNDPVTDINDSDAVTTTVGAVQYSQINPATAPTVGVNYSYDFGYKLRLPTLQITKKIIGGNSAASFPLTIYGPGGAVINTSVISGTPTVLENIPAGVYTVTEQSFPTAPAGYYWVTTPTYTPPNGTANVITGTVAQVQVTNILAQTSFPQATLTLTKTVVGSPQSNYSVRLTGPSHPAGQLYNIISGTNTITNLMPGVYTVMEVSPGAGWVTTYTVGALQTTSSAVVSLTNAITTPTTAVGAIQGTVYRDYNSDGNLQQTASYYENGQSGVIVTAYDRNGLVAGTATTNNAGAYTLNTTRTGPYRLSFSNIPAGYEPSRVTNGTQNGTSTQFVSAPASNVNLAINQPCDYCQNSPQLVLTEMTYGDPMLAPPSNFAALIRFNYDSPGTLTTDTTIDELGAAWGLAYHRTNRLIFASAFQRRFTGYGPLGTGGIYYFNRNTNTLVNWLDVNSIAGVDTGADPHTTLPAVGGATPVRDPDSYDAVGKIGLGDIDISTDEQTLWAVNLNQRTLLEIPVTGNPPAVPTALKVHDLSNKVTCTNGVFRPWGLKFYNNKIYVGGVCSGENGGSQSNLTAHVLVHDPAGSLSSFSQVFSLPLNYAKGCSLNYGGLIDCNGWNVWQTNWPSSFDPGGGGYTAKTQPILSDLEFDVDGSLILGFTDRWGYQTGNANYQPNAPDAALYSGTTGGDILRICLVGGSYVAEGGAGCPKLNNDNIASSPQKQEFYQDAGGGGLHPEGALGALAFLPGRGEVVSTKLDPQSVFAVGATWINNTTGVIRQEFNTMGNPYNKASSIGDIEVLCDAPPLEIGNRVWWDMDGDGVQDGGEPGMSNIQVSRQSPTNTVTTNTNASGHYYFAVSANTAYTLTLNVPAGYSLTPAHRAALSGANVASNHPFSDTIDSDAVLISNKATIFYTTGGPGQNNHGLDFGFGKSARGAMRIRNTAPPPIYDLALRKTLATAGPFNAGQTVIFNLTVFNQGNVTATHISLVDYIPAGLTLADTTNWQVAGGQATSVGHNAHIHDLAAGGVATRTIALSINAGFSGTITNTAEIMAAVVTDALGNPLTVDTDSTPDSQDGNQPGEQAPTRKDDNISENGKSGGDEDDHDLAWLTIAPPAPRYALRKTLITPDPVRVGDDISFTIRITNTGSNAITVLPLRDIYDRSDIIFDYAIVAPDEGSNDGQLDWSDLTVGFGQDLTPGVSFTVTTFFVARHDTSFLPNGATVNTALSPISPTLTVTAPVRIEAPTGVDLASHSASYDLNNGVTLAWTTASEAEIAGFHLLRRELGSGGWVRLNPEMIPAQQPGQASGASYTFSDPTVQFGHTYFYMVEMVDGSGNTSRRELGLVEAGSRVLLPLVAR